jgi:hypothetical protein
MSRFLVFPILIGSTFSNAFTIENVISTSVATTFSKPDATSIIHNDLYPNTEYKLRMDVGKDSQFEDDVTYMSEAISLNDPRLSKTYHEFPLDSMDSLLHIASQEYTRMNGDEPNVLIDLGSGCGRLVLYSALKIGSWKEVHGIEIGQQLHNYACKMIHRGIEKGYFEDDTESNKESNLITKIYLHHGPANEKIHVLKAADVIFCYATVFDTDGFDPDLGTLILNAEWSEMLAKACRKGTIVITTDRALNPMHGWELIQKLDVDNPSLLGSTGYISIKQ